MHGQVVVTLTTDLLTGDVWPWRGVAEGDVNRDAIDRWGLLWGMQTVGLWWIPEGDNVIKMPQSRVTPTG